MLDKFLDKFTAEEIAQARSVLADLGVDRRFPNGDLTDAVAMLGYVRIGLWQLLGDGDRQDDAQLRGLAAMLFVWRYEDTPGEERDRGDRYSRGDTEPPAVPIKPDTLVQDLGTHDRLCDHAEVSA